jgi:hypothetical protein
MEQPIVNEESFNRPIPGQNLTAELGSRPWQNPPQFSTVEETIDYYIGQITTDGFTKSLIHTLKTGVPMTVIANSMQTVGVMEGKHSLDVGILVLPVLMESMMLIADKAGIEYDSGLEDDTKLGSSELAAEVVSGMVAGKMEEETPEEPAVEEEEEKPVGLMARRV